MHKYTLSVLFSGTSSEFFQHRDFYPCSRKCRLFCGEKHAKGKQLWQSETIFKHSHLAAVCAVQHIWQFKVPCSTDYAICFLHSSSTKCWKPPMAEYPKESEETNSFSCRYLPKVIGHLTKPINYCHYLIFHFDIAHAVQTTAKFSSCTVVDELVNVCTKFRKKIN